MSNGGFFESDFIGCSPDGLVNSDGVIEIKSVIAPVHFASIKRDAVDPTYKWQCIANLYFTGRDWIDFVSFCADFPAGKQLFIHRMFKSEYTEEFEMLDERIGSFKDMVNNTRLIILNSK